MSYNTLLNPQDCVLALIDHQPQMLFGTMSHERTALLHNAQILAKTAKLFGVPTILTTIASETFSGHLIPEIQSVFPDQKPIDRTSMNSWEDEGFKAAIKATGRKRVIIAGLWTEVCVTFPRCKCWLKATKSSCRPTPAATPRWKRTSAPCSA